MFDAAWMTFLAVAASAFVFFFFKMRRFDLLTIAYIGAMFYFSPLFWGKVLQSSRELTSTIQPAVYLIATAYVIALVVAAILSGRSSQADAPATQVAHSPSWWYLALAILGLAGALAFSKGAIVNASKVESLKQIGYFYALFEIAASLACISAVIERRWWIVTASAFLLAFDVLVGFRAFVVLTSLSVALVLLARDGAIRLYRKMPTYGVTAFALLVAMLLVHSARFVIFSDAASEMRGDILQYMEPATSDSVAASRWISIPLRLFERSEPFIIQATLVGVMQQDLACSPSNILKSLFLLAPPGFTKIVPDTFPPTFFDEYQPSLYPNVTYGTTGGNIWAEMLCRFGYVGVAIFGGLLILTLIGLGTGLRKASPALTAPMAFSGVIVAFYIHRNDLHYTLVMARQVWMVFVLAYGLSVMTAKVQQSRKHLL
jgi:hypothetical protein